MLANKTGTKCEVATVSAVCTFIVLGYTSCVLVSWTGVHTAILRRYIVDAF